MRAVLVAIVALVAAACSPPAATTSETPETPAAPSADASSAPVLAILTPLITMEVGKPVSLQPVTVNVQDEWAYVAAHPVNPDGSEIDWSTTNLATRYENGVMDTGGNVHALLKNENGIWMVLEHVIAPTDVAWIGWAEAHGVPAGIVPN